MLRQRCRQQGRCATNHAKGFAPAMRTPPRYRTALKRRVIRVHGNHGPDLVIRRKISSRLTPVATHQLDSSGLRQRYYRFTQLEAEDFSAIKILGLVSGAASANRSSGDTDLGLASSGSAAACPRSRSALQQPLFTRFLPAAQPRVWLKVFSRCLDSSG